MQTKVDHQGKRRALHTLLSSPTKKSTAWHGQCEHQTAEDQVPGGPLRRPPALKVDSVNSAHYLPTVTISVISMKYSASDQQWTPFTQDKSL